MNHRRLRRQLLIVALTLGLLSVCVWVWAWAAPIEEPTLRRPPRQPNNRSSDTATHLPLALDDFAQVWSLDLQRPLVDPPSPAKAQPLPPPPPPPLRLQLIGTAIETDRSCAILKDGEGQTVMCSVGDTVGGARLLALSKGKVELEWYNSRVTLEVEAE